MKLLDIMIVSSVEQFFIVDKKREPLAHIKTGIDDINDFDQKMFDSEVLDIKTFNGIIADGLIIKVDYEKANWWQYENIFTKA